MIAMILVLRRLIRKRNRTKGLPMAPRANSRRIKDFTFAFTAGTIHYWPPLEEAQCRMIR